MERTQVQFDPDDISALKREAAARGVSVSAVVREAVSAYFMTRRSADRIARARAAAGTGSSGAQDIARDHDRYLAEDFGP